MPATKPGYPLTMCWRCADGICFPEGHLPVSLCRLAKVPFILSQRECPV